MLVIINGQQKEEAIPSLTINKTSYDLAKGVFLQWSEDGKCQQSNVIPKDIIEAIRTALADLKKVKQRHPFANH